MRTTKEIDDAVMLEAANKIDELRDERNSARSDRDDLSAEMERCHRMLDAYYDEDMTTTSADTLEDRLTELIAVLTARS